MRITLINQFYVPDISPTAHLTTSLAEGLAHAGHHVTVITSKGGYVAPAGGQAEVKAKVAAENPRVRRVWTPQLGKKSILKRCIDYASFYMLAAWRAIRLPRQDVIISLTTPPYIAWVGVFHRMFHWRTKLVLWNMDCYPDVAERAGLLKKGGLASRLMRFMNRALFRRLDHLICLDGAMVHLLISQYGPKRHELPTTIIPNWEKASFFPRPADPPDGAPWEGEEKLGLRDKFVVLYLGNTGVGHPFEAVIDAAKQLKDEPVAFLFVGGGKRWNWLEESKKREGLANLILHPYVKKELTASVMSAADCALITLGSDMLGVMSPSKLHSNLAMGLPVIYVGPKTSNVDEAIERFAIGTSLREGDAAGIVQYIRAAMADPEKFRRQQQLARSAFEAAYCDTQTLPQFTRILEALHGKAEPVA